MKKTNYCGFFYFKKLKDNKQEKSSKKVSDEQEENLQGFTIKFLKK